MSPQETSQQHLPRLPKSDREEQRRTGVDLDIPGPSAPTPEGAVAPYLDGFVAANVDTGQCFATVTAETKGGAARIFKLTRRDDGWGPDRCKECSIAEHLDGSTHSRLRTASGGRLATRRSSGSLAPSLRLGVRCLPPPRLVRSHQRWRRRACTRHSAGCPPPPHPLELPSSPPCSPMQTGARGTPECASGGRRSAPRSLH